MTDVPTCLGEGIHVCMHTYLRTHTCSMHVCRRRHRYMTDGQTDRQTERERERHQFVCLPCYLVTSLLFANHLLSSYWSSCLSILHLLVYQPPASIWVYLVVACYNSLSHAFLKGHRKLLKKQSRFEIPSNPPLSASQQSKNISPEL